MISQRLENLSGIEVSSCGSGSSVVVMLGSIVDHPKTDANSAEGCRRIREEEKKCLLGSCLDEDLKEAVSVVWLHTPRRIIVRTRGG